MTERKRVKEKGKGREGVLDGVIDGGKDKEERERGSEGEEE